MREFNLPFLFFPFAAIARSLARVWRRFVVGIIQPKYTAAAAAGAACFSCCCCLLDTKNNNNNEIKATRAMTTIQARTKTFTYGTPRKRNVA